MRITALKNLSFNHFKSKATSSLSKFSISAPKSLGADIFCFSGNITPKEKISIIPSSKPTSLEKNIEQQLGVEPTPTTVKSFANGETYVNIEGDVRNKDVYLMPAHSESVNDNLMETYLKADAAKRAGAEKVIAILPNFDYARQEKRMEKGEPIAARLNMDLLKTSGVDEIITTDLHTPAIEGFASNDLKITHLESLPLMEEYIKSKNIEDMIVVSPDLGGVKRADKLAKSLGCDKAIVYKHRQAHNEATAKDLIGDVNNKNCIIFDDLIDTAGTIAQAAKMLKSNGAKDIYVLATHGLFNGSAMQRLQDAPVKEVIVTNSLPEKLNPTEKIKQIDLSTPIVEAMKSISC